jgi:glycosyltransferase involved in cell wall biosynthesis
MSTVTVIIPTYNREVVLPRAIESVLSQSFEMFELIVVDDGSSDDTESVVRSYNDSRVEYVGFESNRGANAARKAGVEAASGKYVAFLDSDDEWMPAKISKQVERFESEPDGVGLVYTGVRFVDEDGETVGVSKPKIEGDVSEEMLCDNFIGTFSAAMIDITLLEEVGLPNENIDSGQDWEYFTRCALTSEFRSVPEDLVIYHTDQNNRISHTHVPEKKYEVYRDIYKDEIAEFGALSQRKIIARHEFGLGYSSVQRGEYRRALGFFSKAVILYPFEMRYYVWVITCLGGERTYELMRYAKRRATRIKLSLFT